MSTHRAEDARLEAIIRETIERSTGVLEPDQPTAFSHYEHVRRMRAEFTADERQLIRQTLGLSERSGA